MRFWYWIWDDWFSVGIGWLLPAIALGILAGGLVAQLRFERRFHKGERRRVGQSGE